MNNRLNIPEYEVSQFNLLLKEVVETNFDYVRIRGEISEFKKAVEICDSALIIAPENSSRNPISEFNTCNVVF